MHIIVGLGNPEGEYKGTRHNVGFECINKLAYDHGFEVNQRKHRALIGKGKIAGKPVLLAKPQTYMNRSGESVAEILRFYKLGPEALTVLYDETNLPLGEIRLRQQGSAGGHNGMRDILHHLGDEAAFLRVRIGVGSKPPSWTLSDYVLSRFLTEERDGWIAGVTKAGDAIVKMLADGVSPAMNEFNRKQRCSDD